MTPKEHYEQAEKLLVTANECSQEVAELSKMRGITNADLDIALRTLASVTALAQAHATLATARKR